MSEKKNISIPKTNIVKKETDLCNFRFINNSKLEPIELSRKQN